jgi:very-short-patch-repair endonuclease
MALSLLPDPLICERSPGGTTPIPNPSPQGGREEPGRSAFRKGIHKGRRWLGEAETDEGSQVLERKNSLETLDFARDQRSQPTRAEAAFWQAVRNRRFKDLKFKRQLAIGPFIADFCCFEHRLIVELDGEPHESLDAQARDAARTIFLNREGYRVLRFSNDRVLGNLEFVLREIAETIGLAGLPSSDPASPGHLLPRGEKA